jgi:hypothetical protein
MGFDPRSWARAPAPGRQVTANIDALLAENEALRREVAALRQQLARRQPHGSGVGVGTSRPEVTSGSAPGLSPDQVRRWGESLASHPRWRDLRVGTSLRAGDTLAFSGLRGLIEHQRGQWRDPHAELEAELDRRSPGLGSALRQALRGPQSKVRLAVRAAFAVHGVRAPEWLSEAPWRLVDDLLARIAALEAAARRTQAARDARRNATGTRDASAGGSRTAEAAMDPGRAAALTVLGLPRGASREAIKRAHRSLVKTHHPDRGGDGEDFRRIQAAYQLLMA